MSKIYINSQNIPLDNFEFDTIYDCMTFKEIQPNNGK